MSVTFKLCHFSHLDQSHVTLAKRIKPIMELNLWLVCNSQNLPVDSYLETKIIWLIQKKCWTLPNFRLKNDVFLESMIDQILMFFVYFCLTNCYWSNDQKHRFILFSLIFQSKNGWITDKSYMAQLWPNRRNFQFFEPNLLHVIDVLFILFCFD